MAEKYVIVLMDEVDEHDPGVALAVIGPFADKQTADSHAQKLWGAEVLPLTDP